MKRSYITIALLLALVAGVVVYFTVIKGKGSTSFNKDETAFAIQDTAAIAKIVITQRKRNTEFPPATLSRTANGWKINGKPALQGNVRILLETMHHLSVRQTMKEAGVKMAKEMLAENHIHVQTYNRNNDLIQDYYLGSEINDGKGSICQIEGAETPYVVEMPGLHGAVNTRFTIEEAFWRENLLFDGTLANLNLIQFNYKDPSQSFTARNTGGKWSIDGIQTDTTIFNAWLKLYKGKIHAETFAGEHYPAKKAELQARQPDLSVTLTYTNGSQRQFVLYYMDGSPDRYWGWVTTEGQLLTIQEFVFGPFLKTRAQFEKKK